MARVTWRGVTVDDRTRDMLNEVARLTPNIPYLTPVQGSYNTRVSASAGTHAGGGAVDITCRNLTTAHANETVRIMRSVGFAAWRRLPSQGPWTEHIHGIAIGCPDLSPAAARQVTAYRNGRNGLANNGRDTGPKVGYITWEQYRGGEDDMLGLKQGDKGERVKLLQAMLKYAGHEPVGGQDGDYGPQTAKSVLAVRKSVGSTATSGKEVNYWAAAQIHRAVARNN